MKKKYLLLLILFLLLLFVSSDQKNYSDNEEFMDLENSLEIDFIPHGKLSFIKNGKIIKTIDIELSQKETEKANGLQYRSSLKKDRGMLFILNNKEEYQEINMKNVRIPLDIIYLDQNSIIFFIRKNVPPMIEKIDGFYFNPKKNIKYILEINSGMSDQWGIKEGTTKINWTFNKNKC
ncbi:DUF192 domain-containing protein [Blattabacterium cuenoti]|uniref:DUF192 domain-containing protein n=1 Tax=Blattabacterium cuenoti TaxID=1653831 RepID=UPI00163CCF09|nr:DUF192 domain-containing protein [Blattabacterium cuenoti]